MSRFASMAGEAVSELAERVAEAGRLSRGRALFRKGSVSDLAVGEGSVFASVRGSEGDPYETTVATDLAPPGVIRQMAEAYDPANPMSIDDMIAEGVHVAPRDIDLAFSCDCPDWEEPCKHAIAVLLALADRVDLDEAELLRWRGIDLAASTGDPAEDSPTPSRARSGSGSRSGSRSRSRSGSRSTGRARSVADTAPVQPPTSGQRGEEDAETDSDDRTARLSQLEALLGDTVLRVPPTDGAGRDEAAAPLDPALADFLGNDMALDPIDVRALATPTPLFADVQLGPLADLAPALGDALAIIADRLGAPSTAEASSTVEAEVEVEVEEP